MQKNKVRTRYFVAMTATIIQEFIQALDEEVTAIKKGGGARTVHIFNGKFLREFAGLKEWR
jgi:energy-coupling factor transporter transmembrane protein EcfT